MTEPVEFDVIKKNNIDKSGCISRNMQKKPHYSQALFLVNNDAIINNKDNKAIGDNDNRGCDDNINTCDNLNNVNDDNKNKSSSETGNSSSSIGRKNSDGHLIAEELLTRLELYGVCKECLRPKTGWFWCQPYQHKLIDGFLKSILLSAKSYRDFAQWIPFNRLKNIKFLSKGGFSTVYTAVWLDGWILEWNRIDKCWSRSGERTVIMKVLENSVNANEEYLNNKIRPLFESKFGVIRYYGISQEPKTGNYILIMDYAKLGNLNSFASTSISSSDDSLSSSITSSTTDSSLSFTSSSPQKQKEPQVNGSTTTKDPEGNDQTKLLLERSDSEKSQHSQKRYTKGSRYDSKMVAEDYNDLNESIYIELLNNNDKDDNNYKNNENYKNDNFNYYYKKSG
ncbi:11891_t:CDS:2 [Entrophospora sp. SA101]|nr:11891_t:CDS:2 [Entrophospora sp. SA101]